MSRDGDKGWSGLNSRLDGSLLSRGQYQLGYNVRLEGSRPTQRKGARALHNYNSTVNGAELYTDENQTDNIYIVRIASGSAYEIASWTNGAGSSAVFYPSTSDGLRIIDTPIAMTQAYDRMYFHTAGEKSWVVNREGSPFTFSVVSNANQTISPMDMPYGAGWSLYFRNRLVMPRNGKEVVISDLLGSLQFDIRSQYTFGKGGRDYIVGGSGWKEDSVLIFMRNSIQQISGIVDLTSSTSNEVTDQYGCVARKTILQSGNSISFMTDTGIVQASTTEELKLKERIIPFSRDIQDELDSRNKAFEHNCIAVIHNNRYYLGYPHGSAQFCNRIAVYNYLNQSWESIDTFNSTTEFVDFVIAKYQGVKRLFGVTRSGGLFLLEDRDDGTDDYVSGASTLNEDVVSTFRTRRYDMGNEHLKNFHGFSYSMETELMGTVPTFPATFPVTLNTNASVDISVTANLYERDKTIAFSTYTHSSTEDFKRKHIITAPDANSIDFDIVLTGGQAKLRSINVEASVEGNDYIQQN